MILIASKYLVPKGYAAMAVYPFIFLRRNHYKQDTVLLNHERIHLSQQAELLVIPFFVIYFAEYLIRLAVYFNHSKAYRNISFEREAYSNENNPNYLEYRKFWSFVKHF